MVCLVSKVEFGRYIHVPQVTHMLPFSLLAEVSRLQLYGNLNNISHIAAASRAHSSELNIEFHQIITQQILPLL